MSKLVKNMVIAEIQSRLGNTREMLAIDSSRLDAVTANRFRLALGSRSIRALSVKNSLARRALRDLGIEALDPVLDGPTTLVWGGEDIVALSKEIAGWTREISELEIKGGTAEGKFLDAAGVGQLSTMPGRDELISILAGTLLSPGGQLAGALNGPGSQLAGQIEKISEQNEDVADV